MISAALQTTLAAIIPNTFIAIGDEEIQTPFCVHKERENPQSLKEGISGYEYACEIAIIDDTPDAVETYKQSIISALNALAGTTVSSTQIDMVDYQGDDPDFDIESKLYTTILSFLIETRNR
jgi:hypothetical protein